MAAAARWALEAAAQLAHASATIAGEFKDELNSRIVQAAAAAAAPPLLFGENYLGLDGLATPAAAQDAAAGAAAAHYAIARYFISKCFVGQEDAVFPFVAGGGGQGQDNGGNGMGMMKFRGKIQGEEGSECKMVIVHLMCCGCIMSASAMVSCPSIVALFARWGGVRWLSDVVHVCVQCLLAVEEKLKKLAPPPSRSATASSASTASSSSSSAAAASLSVLRLVECMRARLRVIFEYLHAEAYLLQHRPELALQQLQHSAGALAEVSSLHSAAARIIHDEAREELEAEGRGSVQGRQVSQAASAGGSPRFDLTGPAVPELGPAGSSRLSATASPLPSSSAAAAAPPLLMLRSYSRPKHNRTRYLCVEYHIWSCFSPIPPHTLNRMFTPKKLMRLPALGCRV